MKGHVPILPSKARTRFLSYLGQAISEHFFNVILVLSSTNGSPLSLSQVESLLDLAHEHITIFHRHEPDLTSLCKTQTYLDQKYLQVKGEVVLVDSTVDDAG